MSDKCDLCGNWTPEAFSRYDGMYEDGSELEPVCRCDPRDWGIADDIAQEDHEEDFASQAQLSCLRDMAAERGIDVPTPRSKSHATFLINRLMDIPVEMSGAIEA